MNWIKQNRIAVAGQPGGAWLWLSAASLALLALTGCGQKPAAVVSPPPEVGVVTVQAAAAPITMELPGRIDPVRTAQVRARVAGIVLKLEFTQGANVQAGDVLFQIDPAPFQSIYDSAKASLASAQANVIQAQALADRYTKLVKIRAVSQQDYDNATAAAAQDDASVLVAKAALETASLNLGYATVTAPISGRIGPALVTEGALVGQGEATEMAVIQQMDPIYFDFTESSTELLKLRRAFEKGQLKKVAPDEAKISLLLDDGSTYPHEGKLLFSDVTVDPTTGMVTLRAEFPNPNDWLLPGMFARARLEQAVDAQAIQVPQRGVIYGADGNPTVMVVTPDNKVEVRPVTVSSVAGHDWIITSGLKAGEQVILEGFQKTQPGLTVRPVPFAPTTNAVAGGSENSGTKPAH